MSYSMIPVGLSTVRTELGLPRFNMASVGASSCNLYDRQHQGQGSLFLVYSKF